MTDFPTILYKTPGPHKKPRGGTYAYKGAADQAEFDALKAKGWFASYEEAAAGKTAGKIIEAAEAFEDAVDEVSAPTRDELEARQKNLVSRLMGGLLIRSWQNASLRLWRANRV